MDALSMRIRVPPSGRRNPVPLSHNRFEGLTPHGGSDGKRVTFTFNGLMLRFVEFTKEVEVVVSTASKKRQLLALLAMRAGQLVTMSAAWEELW